MLFKTMIWCTMTGTQLSIPVCTSNQDIVTRRSQDILASSVIFFEAFEGAHPFGKAYRLETGDWPYALQYVDKPGYPDNKCARFEIRKDQPLIENGKRSEVTIIKHLPGREMWYSFSVHFPTDGFETDTERELISQWYQNGSPATSLRVRQDLLYLESGNERDTRKQHTLTQIKKDRWYELVLHFIHAPTTDGLIEVWLDGTKLLEVRGGNMYNDLLPKWKIGVYKAAFKKDKSVVDKRVVYFDNIKVGNATATLNDMRTELTYFKQGSN